MANLLGNSLYAQSLFPHCPWLCLLKNLESKILHFSLSYTCTCSEQWSKGNLLHERKSLHSWKEKASTQEILFPLSFFFCFFFFSRTTPRETAILFQSNKHKNKTHVPMMAEQKDRVSVHLRGQCWTDAWMPEKVTSWLLVIWEK